MDQNLAEQLVHHFLKEHDFTLFEAKQATQLLKLTLLRSKFQQTSSMEEAQFFLGFSYGGQHDVNLQITSPGPQNEQIEDAICEYYETRKSAHKGEKSFTLSVFVQWEIALRGKIRSVVPERSLHILTSPVNPMTAKHDHFSTQQILLKVKATLEAMKMNPATTAVALFAHRYHLPRVFSLAREQGFGRIATPSLDYLPRDQDSQCAYPWLRDFEGFFLANALSLMGALRHEKYLVNLEYFPQK